MSDHQLPATHKALVQEIYGEPLIVQTKNTPTPTSGSAILRVLYAPILTYMQNVYNGKRKYSYPTPLVPGSSAIGRIVATGPDAISLAEGDLVYFDCTIRGRDDSDVIILMGLADGGMSDANRKLMSGEWRDSTFAEYVRVPLENVHVLDEKRLCGPLQDGGLGYPIEQLTWILGALVPYGGLRSIALQPGETVLIAPATGGFGSTGVIVALAMGANVIAMGRDPDKLSKIGALSPRVRTVQITGDIQQEIGELTKFGKVDAYLDISPREAHESSHIQSGMLSLRHEGRVSLMGGLPEIKIPQRFIMRYDITLKGKFMYSRADIKSFLRLITTGVLDVREIVKVVGKYDLEDWEEAFEMAAKSHVGEMVLFTP